MTVSSDWIDHDRQYQLNKSWYDLIFTRRQSVKFCMICLWYGRNSQPILREYYILFLIGIKCLTFIQNFTHNDIVKKRRHKIRDMIIIFQNRIKWGGFQNLHDSFSDWIDHDRQYQLNKSWYDLILTRRQWVKFCMKVKHFIPIKNKMSDWIDHDRQYQLN